jgi:hypothetical protein
MNFVSLRVLVSLWLNGAVVVADTATCDRCGADLLGAEVHYLAEMKVWAAYDVIEIGSRRQLDEIDCRAEYRKALAEAARQTDEEAANSICWSRRYDLCAECQKKFLADPLGRSTGKETEQK